MPGKNCIIAFANNTGWYVQGIKRLKESLQDNFKGTFLYSIGEASIGSPKHADNPYAFKIYCFKKALAAGYKKILYVDSSFYAVAPVSPLFDIIENQGYMMHNSGHWLKDWMDDNQLNYFGIKKNALDKVQMFTGGMVGLNFENPRTIEFFSKWEASMLAGAFIGSWENMRHDMSAGSMIAWLMHFKYLPEETILQYAGPYDAINNESIIFKARGL